MLTSTSRSLVPPAPHPIGQALNVRGANAMIPGIASEDDFSSILIVGTINDSPLAMVQREGAETGTHVDYEIKKERKKSKERGCSVRSGHCLLWIIQTDWLHFIFSFQ